MSTDPFYFSLTRKYVTLFGSLFSDLRIMRTNSAGDLTDLIKVPIGYAIKDKMIARVTEDPNINRQEALQLPLMSFEITGIDYDASRKLGNVGRSTSVNTSFPNSLNSVYNPVPYNIGFQLNAYVKFTEDGTKIIEQILPMFTPDWTVTCELIPEMGLTMDIPIVLNKVSVNDRYAGNLKERQAIIWTLDFTLKGYFYGPVKTSGVIKLADIDFYTPDVLDLQSAVGTSPVVAEVTATPGLTANGQPTSNAAISIPASEIKASDNYGYIDTIIEANT